MFDSNGESGEPCGTPCSLRDHDTVRQHHLGLQQPADQHEQPPILNSLRELGHQPLVADAIKELLQIDVDHPPVPVRQMLLSLGDRRVATPARPEPVTRRDGTSAPRQGSSVCLTASHTTRSITFGIPNPRCPPPAFGIIARRITPGR